MSGCRHIWRRNPLNPRAVMSCTKCGLSRWPEGRAPMEPALIDPEPDAWGFVSEDTGRLLTICPAYFGKPQPIEFYRLVRLSMWPADLVGLDQDDEADG